MLWLLTVILVTRTMFAITTHLTPFAALAARSWFVAMAACNASQIPIPVNASRDQFRGSKIRLERENQSGAGCRLGGTSNEHEGGSMDGASGCGDTRDGLEEDGREVDEWELRPTRKELKMRLRMQQNINDDVPPSLHSMRMGGSRRSGSKKERDYHCSQLLPRVSLLFSISVASIPAYRIKQTIQEPFLLFFFFPAWYRIPIRVAMPKESKEALEFWRHIDALTTIIVVQYRIEHWKSLFVHSAI